MSLFTNDPQSRDVQLRSIRPHALFSFEPSLSLFQTATTDPGHGTKMSGCLFGAVVLPQSLLLYLVTAKMGGIPRRGPTTRLAALDAGRIPNRKGTSRCV